MTTHDEQTDTTASTSTAGDTARARPGPSSAETEPLTPPSVPPDETESPSSQTMTTESPPAQGEPSETGIEPSTGETQPTETGTESSTDDSLFARDDLSGLRSRWDDVQAAFVDDPKECVQKADALVSEVVEQLTTGFSEARSRLEAQWDRGEEASTEVLRVTLKRYREFFQRLLSV
jgi:hypothetical protein